MIIPQLVGAGLGDGDPDVVSLQNALNRFSPITGMLIAVDGIAGQGTANAAAAVTQIQTFSDLFVSGGDFWYRPNSFDQLRSYDYNVLAANAADLASVLNQAADGASFLLPFVPGPSGAGGGPKIVSIPKTTPPIFKPGAKADYTLYIVGGLIVAGGLAVWYIKQQEKKKKGGR